MVKAASCPENRLVFDAFYDAQPVVRVNDLVADFKCHSSPRLESSVWQAEIAPAILLV
jgi:hypothetical protein